MAAVAARARGAVLGSLVADAAATPTHWVYDPAKLAAHMETAERGPAFCDPPANKFYTIPPGGQSCYGDQTLTLLESLVACKKLNIADYAEKLERKFGRDSPYELDALDPESWPDLKKNPKDEEGNIIEEQRQWTLPLPGPWRHSSIKGFLKNYSLHEKRPPLCGSSDEQVDGCCKVAPLVALLAGHPDLLPSVNEAIRVTQNTDVAAAYACGFARVLEKLVLGTASTIDEAIVQARTELTDDSRPFITPLDSEVATDLDRVFQFSGKPHGDVALALKPSKSSFAFAGSA